MDSVEASKNISQNLKEARSIPDLNDRKLFHQLVREEPEYAELRNSKVSGRQRYIKRRIESGGFALPKEANGHVLNHEQEVVGWAQSVYDKFSVVPSGDKRTRREAERTFENTVSYLLSHPQDIDTAASIWKSRSMDERGNMQTGSLYERAKNAISELTQKNWRQITPEQLAFITKAYVHSELAPDFAEEVLRSYFKAPLDTRGKTQTYYKYAQGAIDLVEDNKAIEKAVAIGLFKTNLIPPESDFVSECFMVKSIFGELDSDRASQKQNINAAMIIFTSLSNFTSMEGNAEFINLGFKLSNSPRYKSRLQTEFQRVIRKYGGTSVRNALFSRIEKLGPLKDTSAEEIMANPSQALSKIFQMSEEEVETLVAAGENLTAFTVEDARLNKLWERVLTETARRAFQKASTTFLKGYGIEDATTMSIVTPTGNVADVVFSSSLIDQRKNIMSQVLDETGKLNVDSRGLERGQLLVDGLPLLFMYRTSSEFEDNPHPLHALETFGFPTPRLPEGQTLQEANEQLAQEIQKTMLRFMNSRGVSIPFDQEELRQLGYTKLEIAKHPEQSDKMRASIFFGNSGYSVSLDKYLDFDFEGKNFSAPLISDGLRYIVLSYLRPILCEERISTTKGEQKDLFEVYDRMPHLRLLPADFHRRERAIELCRGNEGRDLLVMDKEQRLDRLRKGNPVPDDREFTYVSPVHQEKEEGLPPLEVKLKGVVAFSKNATTQQTL